VTIGGRQLLGRGRTADIYEWDDGRAVRLEQPGIGRSVAESSRAALASAREAGAPCPAVFDVVEVDGRVGLVMERIDGPDMLNDFAAHPWRLAAYARALADLHAAIVSTPAPMSAHPVRPDLRRQLDDDAIPRPIADVARGLLDVLPDGDRLVHGDFHPGNVLLGPSGPVVIDWENLGAGDPAEDHARTSLLLRHADPPHAAAPLRFLVAGGRRAFARLYERAFRSRVPVAPDATRRWLYVLAAARLSLQIEPERARLLALLANLRQ
jgi:aminoglycoside phosphotransferase (APT) family kinase protein